MPWTLQRVHITDMVESEKRAFNGRHQADVETLAESIRKSGQLIPVLGEYVGHKFHVLEGWKRVLAMKRLGLPYVLTVSFTWQVPEVKFRWFPPARK